MAFEPARTTDDVLEQLQLIIQDCIKNNNRAGYFAVVYYGVTCRVKEDIQKNNFEDGPRMEVFDALFTNRYLEAWHQYKAGKKITDSWQIAFDTARLAPAILLQHLLLGMNAHINLDLGIAAVETMRGGKLQHLRRDFNSINAILGAMIDKVQHNISKVSPLMTLLDLHARNHDELLVGFSINTAREGAWHFARELEGKTGTAYQTCLQTRDNRIACLGNNIARPRSILLNLTLKAVRASEKQAPSQIIQLLNIIEPALT